MRNWIEIAGGAVALVSITAASATGVWWITAAVTAAALAGGGTLLWRRSADAARAQGAAQLGSEREQTRAEIGAVKSHVRDALSGIDALGQRVGGSGSALSDASRQHDAAIATAVTALETIGTATRDVGTTIGRLAGSANETAAAVSALDGSIWQIAENTDVLRRTMEEAGSATSELAAAVGQIAAGADQLGASSDATHQRLARLEESVRSVEDNASQTHRVSEEALSHAREGIDRVQELDVGMREIDESFHGVQATIERLAERSVSINEIVGLIDEIVSRTHLLALNASIIAAQAGEQGKSFSVVAREVRDLAHLTSNSTKEIAGHVKAVREQVGEAVEAVEMGAARVASGRSLSDAAASSLRQIHDGSEQATAMTREIADSAEVQSAELSAVQAAMSQVSTLVHQIGEATREQKTSSKTILTNLDQMGDLARSVAEGCSKQAGDSRQITEAAASLAEGIEEIRHATEQQRGRNEEILGDLRSVGSLAEAGARHASELGEGVQELHEQTAALTDEIERL